MGQMARHRLEGQLEPSFAFLTSNNYSPNYPALGGLLYSDRTDGPSPEQYRLDHQSTRAEEGGGGGNFL